MSATQQRLRSAGLRVTKPRVAVLDALDERSAEQRHLLVSELVDEVRKRLGKVSVQAVYDCLVALSAAGLVRRIEVAGSPARFETRVGDNHHHLVCRECGQTVDIDCVVGSAPCLDPSDTHGFVIDEAEVVFWGRCGACEREAVGTRAG